MPPPGHPLRARAIGLTQLHRLGREYPDPNYHFLPKLRAMFRKNAHLTDTQEIESKLALAEFVKRETETLYRLKKYRTLRRRSVSSWSHGRKACHRATAAPQHHRYRGAVARVSLLHMTIPDYYGILGVPPTASQEAIKKAYQRESLRSHPDRFPNATPEETHAHTQRFQNYMLSDPARRAEYDSMRTQQGYASSADDASTQDESARFFRMFGRGGPSEQPQAQGLFADVWEEMLRPEVEHHIAGFVLGYILANWPGGTYKPLTQRWVVPRSGTGSAPCATPRGSR
ncbi:unnamed protein product [Malassezia sympodialis ATCC 42132]|uniref:uncharacterized protein n=1 Tax=Malassezia sympodialis (strain ATCC 42132) TaxID=1230383 RepID=UPI0002C1B71D|nr:uncharacterized protein MSY001_0503 [Malassezia sympodialis ATCC 42132]CCU97797.1 unnamed protein product [Malassezia sympodialis ATCC 42132]|eukprot:XP_018739131.1 uncharacterized protein MSY001_0503 [Malassezia sympodialis ATCC 42132]